MTVRLDEMTWPEVKEVLKKLNAVILPVGSTEEHGTHLPLNIDSFAATYISEQAARKVTHEHKDVSVLVAPTIHYSDVSVHKMFPGTIGVKVDTLIRMIEDIVRNFLEQGFKNIIVFVSHMENSCSVEAALRKVADECPHARLYALSSMGLGFDVRQPGFYKAGIAGIGHALEVETSEALVMQPQNVKLDKAVKGHRKLPLSERYIGATGMDKSKGVFYYSGVKGWEESGVMGDPTMATKEQGEKVINAVADNIADIILQVVKSEE